MVSADDQIMGCATLAWKGRSVSTTSDNQNDADGSEAILLLQSSDWAPDGSVASLGALCRQRWLCCSEQNSCLARCLVFCNSEHKPDRTIVPHDQSHRIA